MRLKIKKKIIGLFIVLSIGISAGFQSDFFEVATVQGGGNSSNELNYELVDDSPKTLTYYRLTQVDFDGKFETFDIIAVKNGNQIEEEIELLYSVNVNGQIVDNEYTGMIIEYYSDNTYVKKFQVKNN